MGSLINDPPFQHIETIQLICNINQLTGFYMMGKLFVNKLKIIIQIIIPFHDIVLFLSQPAIACSKLTIEALEQGVKYVQS